MIPLINIPQNSDSYPQSPDSYEDNLITSLSELEDTKCAMVTPEGKITQWAGRRLFKNLGKPFFKKAGTWKAHSDMANLIQAMNTLTLTKRTGEKVDDARITLIEIAKETVKRKKRLDQIKLNSKISELEACMIPDKDLIAGTYEYRDAKLIAIPPRKSKHLSISLQRGISIPQVDDKIRTKPCGVFEAFLLSGDRVPDGACIRVSVSLGDERVGFLKVAYQWNKGYYLADQKKVPFPTLTLKALVIAEVAKRYLALEDVGSWTAVPDGEQHWILLVKNTREKVEALHVFESSYQQFYVLHNPTDAIVTKPSLAEIATQNVPGISKKLKKISYNFIEKIY